MLEAEEAAAEVGEAEAEGTTTTAEWRGFAGALRDEPGARAPPQWIVRAQLDQRQQSEQLSRVALQLEGGGGGGMNASSAELAP